MDPCRTGNRKDDALKLLQLHNENHSNAALAKQFNDKLKPLLIQQLIDKSRQHLYKRISSSGWPHGPQPAFLEWMAEASKQSISSVQRFAVIRWALTEDSDRWLQQRGKYTRDGTCCNCGNQARKYPLGPQHRALSNQRRPTEAIWYPATLTDADQNAIRNNLQLTLPILTEDTKALLPIIGAAHEEVPDSLALPCVWRHTGSNTIDHWRQFCPIPHCAAMLLHTDHTASWNRTTKPTVAQGTINAQLLFHMRQLLLEQGALSGDHSELVLSEHPSKPILELTRRTYQSLPHTLTPTITLPQDWTWTSCLHARNFKVQQFARTTQEAALFPKKALVANQRQEKHEILGVLHHKDPRLSLLRQQQIKYPTPTCMVKLFPMQCQRGKIHIQIVAVGNVEPNNILTLQVGQSDPILLFQFDPSAHKKNQKGGAGIAVFKITSTNTELLHWEAWAIPTCKDNIEAEGERLSSNVTDCGRHVERQPLLDQPIQSGVLQRDILPILNYLTYQAKWKNTHVLPDLEQCRAILSRLTDRLQLQYAPRGCNKIADWLAGVGPQHALEEPS